MADTLKLTIDPAHPDERLLKQAADIISGGGLVIIPTETVYGIAGSLLNKKALERLYEIKQRPKEKPFTVLVDDKEKIDEITRMLTVTAYKLIHAFLPGPLTLILRAKEQGTIGVRVPDHEAARRIIALCGVPVVCPSANLSGKPAPISFEQALEDLEGKVDCALDGGRTRLAAESTIVDLSGEPLRIVREGAIPRERIEAAASQKTLLFVCTGNSCRSVMAQAMMRKILQDKGAENTEVLSAGTMSMQGIEASAMAQAVLRTEGIDVSGHRSQQVTREMLTRSDMIVVMEKAHEEEILKRAPQVKNRLFLLKEFAKISEENQDLRDPIGQGFEVYQATFAVIKEALYKIAEII